MATLRSYGMDLLRWFRFCWAAGLEWDQVTRAEARDFCRWLLIAGKPGSPVTVSRRATPNPVTGSRTGGVTRRRRRRTARRCCGTSTISTSRPGPGPMVNPFPLARGRAGRPGAHHNPMDPFPATAGPGCSGPGCRSGPRAASPMSSSASCSPGSARTATGRWSRSGSRPGARAAELLGATAADADAGQQLITVIRKGTRAMQQLPASPDAFVWLRLYQEQMRGLVPAGPDQPLWWTLRRPFRQLTYHAALAHVHPGRRRAREATGRCTTCGIPPPTGWPGIRRCR